MLKCVLMIVCLLSIAAQAQELSFFKKCPNPSVVSNLDANRYLGKWYENRKYFAIFQFGGRCASAKYSDAGNGLIKVENNQLNIFGKPSGVVGQAKFANPSSREGKLSVSFSSPTPYANNSNAVTDSNYWVLDTDYNSYAVVWSCTSALIANIQFMWVLTRDPQPSEALVNKTLTIIRNKGLDPTRLSITDQNNCK
ncbi:apolipoprotein D isoform X2 [Hyalella azteca]|uniref:Apolipoprotein D n=1 Tax=Hyalella azteca TaxID=294128 RepID=A0A8B7P8I7_HYAAZ|nr:apolipoprotein D isoform X2 [Hyalella azteca]